MKDKILNIIEVIISLKFLIILMMIITLSQFTNIIHYENYISKFSCMILYGVGMYIPIKIVYKDYANSGEFRLNEVLKKRGRDINSMRKRKMTIIDVLILCMYIIIIIVAYSVVIYSVCLLARSAVTGL